MGEWGWAGGGCTQFVRGRSSMTIDLRIPTMPRGGGEGQGRVFLSRVARESTDWPRATSRTRENKDSTERTVSPRRRTKGGSLGGSLGSHRR